MSKSICLDLALQGGGANGAFTWGVLDRLLDEPTWKCGALSGASAGAINAVVFASGWQRGGRRGAQHALWRFWKAVSRNAHFGLFGNAFLTVFANAHEAQEPLSPWDPWGLAARYWQSWAKTTMQSFSPYQFNPLNINPLQTLLEAHVDFEALRADEAPRLFLSATDVRTGRLRLFSNGEVTARSVMASACLPQLFHAVELDGVPYWDGAYVANPALLPLIADSAPQDLLIIQLNPATRNARPRTASAVAARLNEITFNASLMQELRGLALLKRALDEENSVNELRTPLFHQVRTLKLHRIAADESQVELSAHRAADAEWAYLIRMHRIGAAAADAWLRQHGGKLGKTSSLKYGELA